MSRKPIAVMTLMGAVILFAGCQKPVHFPDLSMAAAAGQVGAAGAFDTDHDGKADFFTFANAAGRVDRIAYDVDGDEKPDATVNLDAIHFQRCRHVVLILDGVGYDLVKRYYDEGHLRMFYPPSRVVAPYPSMTDLCLEDVFGYIPCRGIEARYYDLQANRLAGGSSDYVAGKNEPYNRLLHYRANLLWDAIGYLAPWEVFGKEVNDAKRVLNRSETQEFVAYFVSSAGLATRMGAAGHKACLGRVEQLIHQILWETHGLTKFTLLADHGHTYTPAERIDLGAKLREKGWSLVNSVRGERDVAYISFGLVTYASFATRRPAALAADLVGLPAVELASYVEGDVVVVLDSRGGRALIRQDNGRFRYEPLEGDPLQLEESLSGVEADERGYYDAEALLAATAGHVYPAPLQRLWRAHFAIVENPPDVIVSLKDDFCSGSKSFASHVTTASTHGGLNRRNSITFIMSTIGPLPPIMRSGDIRRHMKRLTGREFPMSR